ncbi:MAG: NmrA/HSCARG family protein [Gemmatimonadales bacterium]
MAAHEKKIIAVVGATRAQGGGQVSAILADPNGPFRVRALTRDPDSEKGQALATGGAEVVVADLDDERSLERAFAGAYGAFCLTNFFEHFSPEKELAQAENMAQAAKTAKLQHVIWSTLEDTRRWVPLSDDRMPTLQGKYKVPHFDARGEADELFRREGVPTTLLLTSFYWENLIHAGSGPQRMPDGSLALVFPMDDRKLPAIAVDDIGKAAYAIFKRGKEFIGKTVGIAGENLSGAELAAAMSRALGQPIGYVNVAPEVFRGFGFPAADDLGNMFQFMRDFNDDFRGARDLGFSRNLVPDMQTFEQWLGRHKREIPIPA